MTVTATSAWKNLATAAKGLSQQPLKDLVCDAQRNAGLVFDLAGCRIDFAKQWITPQVNNQLLALAAQRHVAEQAAAMLRGEPINRSEHRAVLHSALRGGAPNVSPEITVSVNDTLQRMRSFAEGIRSGRKRGYTGKAFRDVVHIGIGGSHLGPELVTNALRDFATTSLRVHFVANIDANELHDALAGLNPETTLFIVVSKSFGTLETKVNANSARSWFLERTAAPQAIADHFIGVTTNIEAASEFGLDPDNLLPMWDWVGGRFSLWSAVGLPILLSIGTEHHQAFLDGAREVDLHFANAAPDANVPLLKALYGIWNYNFLGAGSLAVLSYDERLGLLPDYLQQLEMESNGKSVSQQGDPVGVHTMPILWGGTGTKGQHAYHQLLHQGTRAYTADFIVVGRDDRALREHHDWLVANAFAQAEAMAVGFHAGDDEPHRNVPGNHPSTTILFDALEPRQLGALLAMYEHKVFCQGAIWGLNSFDQWGVELGKQLAVPIYEQLSSGNTQAESVNATMQLVEYLRTSKR